ncbi:M15 family peptidase, partial [Acinetobacter baumannii]|uniref:M15 family metallopeptidase n=1 Tax=Acinetobacter baumannii TaxID=470 RepID=UPI001EEFA410
MGGDRATRAGSWQSCHQYGLAVDSAPLRDGKLQWDMGDPWTRRACSLYGELAQQAGLEWGGSWRSIKDYVHLEKLEACRSARAAKRAELAQG